MAVSSSKIWRKGRWWWLCCEDNNASNWQDHWACSACSRLTYSTREKAVKAGNRHGNRTCHKVVVSRID